jgi:hypothetical protein
MAATKLDEFGRPIDNPFFGGGGLGGALASLPGTPVLGAATPPPATGGYEQPGAQGPLAGGSPPPSTPQTNPGLPPPPSTAGTGGFWGDTSPWAQNVGASINNSPVSFASPGNPNPNYITPEAASKIGQTFGANVVSQNLNNMSSPGSSAPSAPIYGLDFGRGDFQGADVAATGLARGDRPEDIAARYAAGLNTKAWAGDVPVPTTARADADGMWNYSNPVSTYDPSQSNAQQAALIQWLKGQIGG